MRFNGSLHKQPIRTGETSYGYVRTLHILEAANGTTPPKTKEAVIVTNAVRMSKELNSIDQIFFESDRMHPTDKTRKLSATIWVMRSFEEERNV